MGFMDKVKAQATVLADKAQTGVQQGQTKFQEMQTSKQADHLLRELGAYIFLSERGRTPADSEAEVAGIMSQLDALEAAGTPVTVTPEPMSVPAGGAVPQPGAPTSPPGTAASSPMGNPVPPDVEHPPTGGSVPQSSNRLPGQ